MGAFSGLGVAVLWGILVKGPVVVQIMAGLR